MSSCSKPFCGYDSCHHQTLHSLPHQQFLTPFTVTWWPWPTFEPPHDKTNKMTVHPAKTQISLGIRPVWSGSSLCAQWVAKDPSFLHADSEDFNQTGRMPRPIWVFARRTVILLVLSWGGSFNVPVNLSKFTSTLAITSRGSSNAERPVNKGRPVLCHFWIHFTMEKSGNSIPCKYALPSQNPLMHCLD